MLREGATLLEGDVLFAAGLFPTQRSFVVDNAADFSDSLLDCV